MTPPAPERPATPDDLRTALGPPTSYGVKLFEVVVLLAILKACPDVKDAGDLLILRKTLLEDMGPAYMMPEDTRVYASMLVRHNIVPEKLLF